MSKLILEHTLPDSWIEVTLDQILEPSKQKFDPTKEKNQFFIGLEHIESKSGKIIGRGNSKDTKSTKSIFKNGDILYGKLRPYLNKVTVPNFDGVCSTDILVFSKNNNLNSKYVALFLSTNEFVRFANRNMSGVQHPRIKFDKFSEFSIPLPSLNEQKRIVEKIEALFSLIDNIVKMLNKSKIQLKLYIQSLFHSLFSNIENKSRIDECAVVGTGGTPSRKHPEYYNGNIPWVKTTEVQNSIINSTSERISKTGLKNSNARIYSKNSIILAMYGEGKTRGQCAILGIEASTNQACAVISCNPEKLFFRFCFYWFQSQYHQMRLKSSGGNQPNLNLGIVKKTEIPLPSIKKQKEIASIIEQGFSLVKNSENIVKSMLNELESLRSSILKQAFEGKLIPQDPNDESAKVLLQKIKQEKEKITQKQKRSRKKKIVK